MPENLPGEIERDHIIEAISRYDSGIDHQFAESTVYDVLFNGKRYPPKAIVGIASEVLTGTSLGPKDFKGGQESKCFRVLQRSEFQIVRKVGAEADAAWIFQGNPKRYDIDDYLSRYSYIYWSAPRHRSELRVGDPCLVWRSGEKAGAIAIGRIAEAPQQISDVNFLDCLGEDLWRDSPETIKVGIEVDDVRLDENEGYIPRSVLLTNSLLSQSRIIRSSQGTVFRLTPDEAKELFSLWNTPLDLAPEALPTAMEGAQR